MTKRTTRGLKTAVPEAKAAGSWVPACPRTNAVAVCKADEVVRANACTPDAASFKGRMTTLDVVDDKWAAEAVAFSLARAVGRRIRVRTQRGGRLAPAMEKREDEIPPDAVCRA